MHNSAVAHIVLKLAQIHLPIDLTTILNSDRNSVQQNMKVVLADDRMCAHLFAPTILSSAILSYCVNSTKHEISDPRPSPESPKLFTSSE